MFPARGTASRGLFENADQGSIVRLYSKELVYITDGLQVHGANLRPDSFEFALPFVYQMGRTENNRATSLTTRSNSCTYGGFS
jgi:hypothetical protein